MRNFIFLFFISISFAACDPATLQQAMGTLLEGGSPLTSEQVGLGLKEALTNGISKGSDRLSLTDGYFKSQYKILLPEEARKITDKLEKVPLFSDVENIILEKINRGAEDAAKKAKPIFISAIKQMTFADAMDILMGSDDAASNYLKRTTFNQLYQEFNPIIVESLDKFDARKYWGDAVKTYNSIPFVDKMNPSLDDYVTREALKGLFSMVEKEELNIRKNVSSRTSDLLKKVFAKQDNK